MQYRKLGNTGLEVRRSIEFTLSNSKAHCESVNGRLVVSNDYLSLDIISDGGVNPTKPLCKKTRKVYADSKYRYNSFKCESIERLKSAQQNKGGEQCCICQNHD